MLERRSLKFPVALGVVMIVLLVAITIGWVLLTVFGALVQEEWAFIYYTLLSAGSAILTLLLVGTSLYLALTVKAINLNRQQSNFIDSVTHELKSPIASLKLYLQTLHRRQVTPEEQVDFFRYMLEDVERLDQLINHVLDAGRVEKGSPEKPAELVDVGARLRETAAMVCSRYRTPPETVMLDLEPCLVRTSVADLDMVLRNLLDNGVKYAGAPPQVHVSLRRTFDGWAVIRIADNGRGVSRRDRRRLFRRFVRLGSELERQQPGTGLGLYIVRTLVRRMKGKVEILDRPEGDGAAFELRLPNAEAEPAPASGEKQGEAAQAF